MNALYDSALDLALDDQRGSLEIPLQHIPLGLAVFDQQFVLRHYNTLWASSVTQYPASPASHVEPGRHLVELLPGAELSLMPLFERALAGQVVRQEAVKLESNGQVSYWDMTFAPLIKNEQVLGVVNVIAEVTERVVAQQALEQRAEARIHEWEAMLTVARELTALKPELLLNLILDQLKELVDYTRAAVVRLEKDHLAVLVYRAPTPEEEALARQSHFADTWLRHEVIRRREPIIVADTHSHTPPARAFWELVDKLPDFNLADMRSWLGVPIIIQEQVIGVLSLFHHEPNCYSPDQVGLVLAFAHHIAIALENDRLYQQVHQLATLTERERLARALHDRLAQVLGYINLKSSLTNELLTNGQIGEAQTHLLELKQVTKETYTDVREAIFNLRTKLDAGVSFLPTLHDYLMEYKARYGLEVQVVVENESLVEFSAKVSTQLIRIIQEALSNVRKHAQANQVTIHFTQENDRVCLTIADDGQGFDLEQFRKGERLNFGLDIMRERAESVGGQVEIEAVPGRGTRIMVWVPSPSGE